jgi:hypothetical protein
METIFILMFITIYRQNFWLFGKDAVYKLIINWPIWTDYINILS